MIEVDVLKYASTFFCADLFMTYGLFFFLIFHYLCRIIEGIMKNIWKYLVVSAWLVMLPVLFSCSDANDDAREIPVVKPDVPMGDGTLPTTASTSCST